MLNQNALTPLYEQLKNAIKDDIHAQIYRPGDRMPSEAELEEKYQVSRITVRRAVKELCEEEILVRKQGKGTFVLSTGVQSRIDQLAGFHDSMESQGRTVRTEILEKSIIFVKPSYANDLQISVDDKVVYLKRVMYADDIPMMLDMCYIPLKRFPGIFEKMEGNVSVFQLLRQEYHAKLDRYYKVLKVRKASRKFSEYLKCGLGDPLFDIFKITYNEEGVAQHISISILKGENTSYVISNSENDQMTHSGISWRV